MEPVKISNQTARRFVLGRQGLWPGRRWQGLEGAAQAIRECEGVQLDPLNIGARSQDIFLHSRVANYRSEYLYQLLYEQRRFFDYGGALFVYPIEEFPYRRLQMERFKENPHWRAIRHVTPAGLELVRSELSARGPLGNRDFKGPRTISSYRGGKESALALYYLWLAGEVMVHHRVGFDRVYDFTKNILPPELSYVPEEQECLAYFGRKAVAEVGLARLVGWKNTVNDYLQAHMDAAEAQKVVDAQIEAGEFVPVQVEGDRQRRFALASDVPLIEIVAGGSVPDAWQPVGRTTEQEVNILAPLDIVSARGRAAVLFGFDYVWEVYKPLHLRRWGYYNMPVQYGDRLVAILDPRLDKATRTLRILGFWLVEGALASDDGFAAALGRGLRRFGHLTGAEQVDLAGLEPTNLRIATETHCRNQD